MSEVLILLEMERKKGKSDAYSTAYSQAVTHPSTNAAQRCLTSVIGRELVFSTWYGRIQYCEVKKVKLTLLDDFMLSSMWGVPPYFLLLVEALKLF